MCFRDFFIIFDVMGWRNFFKRKSKKDKLKDLEPLIKLVEDRQKTNDKTLPKKEEYEIRGHLFKLGDKVICRSNECDPLLVGEIVEFWDNNGKWTNCIPYVKDEKGVIFGVVGIIKPYSEKLMSEIENLRPLEQYNYFLPENSPHRYTEKDMDRKDKAYKNRKNIGQ